MIGIVQGFAWQHKRQMQTIGCERNFVVGSMNGREENPVVQPGKHSRCVPGQLPLLSVPWILFVRSRSKLPPSFGNPAPERLP